MTTTATQRAQSGFIPTPRATLAPRPPAPKPGQRGVPAVDVRDFGFAYGARQVLRNLSFGIERKAVTAIIGPSGCGKSTLLNLIVGLLRSSFGRIVFRGDPINGICTKIGYVTQKDNLLPWRTLIENVEIALEIRGRDKSDRRQRAQELIERVGLSGFEDHYPHELSGGMRQRANIIRTLIYDPELILMDEPFGPLDAQTRLVLQDQLLKLWSASKKTIVFITHDLIEAITLADRVVLMTSRPGRIKTIENVAIPRPREVFKIHESEQFRSAYERLWQQLRPEVTLAEA